MPSSCAAFFTSDVGRRVEDHLTDAIGQVEQLADRRAPLEPGAAALDAAGAFVERVRVGELRDRAPTPPSARARRAPAACSARRSAAPSRCAITQFSADTN